MMMINVEKRKRTEERVYYYVRFVWNGHHEVFGWSAPLDDGCCESHEHAPWSEESLHVKQMKRCSHEKSDDDQPNQDHDRKMKGNAYQIIFTKLKVIFHFIRRQK